jgi:hypothetical protein
MCFYHGENTEKNNINKIFGLLIKSSYNLAFFQFIINSANKIFQLIPTPTLISILGIFFFFDIPPFQEGMNKIDAGSTMLQFYFKCNSILVALISIFSTGGLLSIIIGNAHRIGVLIGLSFFFFFLFILIF